MRFVVAHRGAHLGDDAAARDVRVVAADEQAGVRVGQRPEGADEVLQALLADDPAEEADVRAVGLPVVRPPGRRGRAGRRDDVHRRLDRRPHAAVPRVVLAGHGHRDGAAHGQPVRRVDDDPLHVVDQAGRQRHVAVVGRDQRRAQARGDRAGLEHRQLQRRHPRPAQRLAAQRHELRADHAAAHPGEHRRAQHPDAVDLLLQREAGVEVAGDDGDACGRARRAPRRCRGPCSSGPRRTGSSRSGRSRGRRSRLGQGVRHAAALALVVRW